MTQTCVPRHLLLTKWARLDPAEEELHGRAVWSRKCLVCDFSQFTSVDPAAPDHPDSVLIDRT